MPLNKDQPAVHDQFASCGHDIENCTCDQVTHWRGKCVTSIFVAKTCTFIQRLNICPGSYAVTSYIVHVLAFFRFSE